MNDIVYFNINGCPLSYDRDKHIVRTKYTKCGDTIIKLQRKGEIAYSLRAIIISGKIPRLVVGHNILLFLYPNRPRNMTGKKFLDILSSID